MKEVAYHIEILNIKEQPPLTPPWKGGETKRNNHYKLPSFLRRGKGWLTPIYLNYFNRLLMLLNIVINSMQITCKSGLTDD